MDVGGFLSEISGGLLQFIPEFGRALLHCFIALFFTTEAAEGATGIGEVTGLNILGTVATAFIIMSLCLQMLPTVLGWMRMGISKMKRRRRVGKKA